MLPLFLSILSLVLFSDTRGDLLQFGWTVSTHDQVPAGIIWRKVDRQHGMYVAVVRDSPLLLLWLLCVETGSVKIWFKSGNFWCILSASTL